MSIGKIPFYLCLAAGLSSCMGRWTPQSGASPKNVAATSTSTRSLDEIQADIDDLTADLSCAASSQCQVAQYGVQACGGASRAQIYSEATVEAAKLFQLASEYNAVNQKQNLQNAVVGSCSLLELPELACVNGHCAEVP